MFKNLLIKSSSFGTFCKNVSLFSLNQELAGKWQKLLFRIIFLAFVLLTISNYFSGIRFTERNYKRKL